MDRVPDMIDKNPLKGKRILVTRQKEQADSFCRMLEDCGAIALQLPLIRIGPPDSWVAFDQAIRNLHNYEWIIFASANAVISSMERIKQTHLQTELQDLLRDKKIACIGKETQNTLAKYKLEAAFVPTNFVAESFAEEFIKKFAETKTGSNSSHILWPRTNMGRRTIQTELERSAWKVDLVHSYSTLGPENLSEATDYLIKLLCDPDAAGLDAITLTSSQTVRNLGIISKHSAQFQANSDAIKRLENTVLAAIGPETARTCVEIFGRVDVQAETFTGSGLIDGLAAKFAISKTSTSS